MKHSFKSFLLVAAIVIAGSYAQQACAQISFTDQFQRIDAKDIPGEPFTLVSKNLAILTAGTPDKYNSMVTSWGGWGIQFGKPAIFHMLRSNRYTLEVMRESGIYTVCFFDEEYRSEYMRFGMKSGRDSQKMSETKLTPVKAPSGSMAYMEAAMVLECTLMGVTTVSPNDFTDESNRKFVVDAYTETGDYHKLVFGEITNVWVRK